MFVLELLILGGSDCGDYFNEILARCQNHTVADEWRTFSNCGGSDFNVVGPPREKDSE